MTNSEKIGYKKRPYRVYATGYEVQTVKKILVLNESYKRGCQEKIFPFLSGVGR
jgi:hypothetical protein